MFTQDLLSLLSPAKFNPKIINHFIQNYKIIQTQNPTSITDSTPTSGSVIYIDAPKLIFAPHPPPPQKSNFFAFLLKFSWENSSPGRYLRMRRRAEEYSGLPVTVRKQPSKGLWRWFRRALSGIAVLLFIFFMSQGSWNEWRPAIPKVKKRSGFCLVWFGLVFIH